MIHNICLVVRHLPAFNAIAIWGPLPGWRWSPGFLHALRLGLRLSGGFFVSHCFERYQLTFS